LTDHAPTIERGAPAPAWLPWLTAAFLAACALALYLPTLDGGLLYDDITLVREAPATRSLGAALAAFLEPMFGYQDGAEVARGIWRPLNVVWLALGGALSGEDSFAGHHLVSILTHVAAAVALARLLALLLRTRTGVGPVNAEGLAGALALLFTVHPASVEAVAWISAVNDPLWALFGFLALASYERAALAGRRPFAALALMFVALLAKESAVVLFGLALLLDWSAGRLGGVRGALRRAAWLAAPIALWFALRTVVFEEAAGGLLRRSGDYGLASTLREITLRVELAGGFALNALWPADPEVFRPIHPTPPEGSSAIRDGLLVLAVAAGTVAALALRPRTRTAAAALVGFFAVVSPFVLLPDRAGHFPLSDRYLYGALGMLAIAAAVLGSRAIGARATAAVAALLAVPAFLTARGELPQYESRVAFQRQAVLDAPDCPNVRWATGNALLEEYLRTEDISLLEAAYVHHMVSLRLGKVYGDEDELHDPTKPASEVLSPLFVSLNGPARGELPEDPTVFLTVEDRYQATLGQIQAEILRTARTDEKDYELVLARIDQALQLWSQVPGYRRRGDLASLRIQVLQRMGRMDELEAELAASIADRGDASARDLSRLAALRSMEGDAGAAKAALERAVLLEPDDAGMWTRLSIAALETRQVDRAAEAIERAYELSRGRDTDVLVQRSVVDLERARTSDALGWVDRALEIDPGNGLALRQRAKIRLVLQDFEGALRDLQEAARALPEDFFVHYNLAALMLGQDPGESVTPDVRDEWRIGVRDVVIRAYLLADPRGREQLLLQERLEGLIGPDPDAALQLAATLDAQNRSLLALHWRVVAVELAGEWTEAERRRKLPPALVKIGTARRAAERFQSALEALGEAARIAPDHFPARLELGMLLYERGRPAAARPHLEAALEMLPGAPLRPGARAAVEDTLRRRLAAIDGDGE